MLHGQGDNQKWLKKSYEEDRQKALLDREGFSDEELEDLEVSVPQGGGSTDPNTWYIWQDPFPIDASVRPRKKVYINKLLPRVGEGSD